MRSAKKIGVALVGLVACATVFGQSGDFTVKGRVLVGGQPLAMATITYQNLSQSLSWDFSKADGTFGGYIVSTKNPMVQDAKVVLPSEGPVTIDVFEMSGKLAASVSGRLDKGTYSLQPVASKLSQSMYMLRIKTGSSTTYQKMLNTGLKSSGYVVSLTSSKEALVLAKKMAAIDSIRIGKTGYASVTVPISTYTDNVGDQTLTAIDIEGEVTALMGTLSNAQKFGQLAMPPDPNNGWIATSVFTNNCVGSLFGGGGALMGSSASACATNIDAIQNAMMGSTTKIPILAAFDFVHGASACPGATMFPHNLAMGAIQDTLLIQKAFRVQALEVRGTGCNWGFGPCIAVIRDDRWGRAYEGFCETPDRTQIMARHAVLGIQLSDLSCPLTYAACCKHFAGDGNTTNGVNEGVTVGPDATARAINLPGYLSAVQAGVATIMPSFSSWCDNVPMHQNKKLITGWLKSDSTGQPNFKGFTVGDYEAAWPLPTCCDAGVDVPMAPGTNSANPPGIIATNDKAANNNYTSLYASGGTFPARIMDAVTRVVRVKYWMNLFDKSQYLTNPGLTAAVGSAAHREVARECVRASQVLLKNGTVGGTPVLPIPLNANVAVMGQPGQDIGVQCGGWTVSWQGQPGAIPGGGGTSILQAIQKTCTGTVTATASGPAASTADYVLAFLGELPYAETSFPAITLSPDKDNWGGPSNAANGDLECPTNANVITNIAAAHAAGKKVIGVLVAGRPLDISAVIANCDAFVWSCLPGSEGQGVADVLFATGYKFTGKLPVTWPQSNYTGYNANGLFAYGYGLTD